MFFELGESGSPQPPTNCLFLRELSWSWASSIHAIYSVFVFIPLFNIELWDGTKRRGHPTTFIKSRDCINIIHNISWEPPSIILRLHMRSNVIYWITLTKIILAVTSSATYARPATNSDRPNKRSAMELFSSRRWRLDRPKQKAVVFMLNRKN